MTGGGVKETLSVTLDRFRPLVVCKTGAVASAIRHNVQYCRCFPGVSGLNLLDVVRLLWRKYYDTRNAPSSQTTTGRQDAGPARGRGPAPAPRGRPRRRLSEPPVLRPARPRPGQVRDGAPPAGRGAGGDRGRRALRGQPPDVLPGRDRVRGARDSRVGAQASRAEAGPQMHRRRCRLRRTLAGGRRRTTGRITVGGRDAAVRDLDSRPITRPGSGSPQKKPRS